MEILEGKNEDFRGKTESLWGNIFWGKKWGFWEKPGDIKVGKNGDFRRKRK